MTGAEIDGENAHQRIAANIAKLPVLLRKA
jgi:hypothetical protein